MNKNPKIVKIIDDKTLIINIGKNDSISINDKIEIFTSGMEIFDPETKESLGHLDFIKDTLTVTSVYDKMSICKNVQYRPSPVEFFGNSLASTILSKKEEGEYYTKSLLVDPMNISGCNENFDKTIRIGDFVRKVL